MTDMAEPSNIPWRKRKRRKQVVAMRAFQSEREWGTGNRLWGSGQCGQPWCVSRRCSKGSWLAAPPPLPTIHRTPAYKVQVHMLRDSCLHLSKKMLSMWVWFNSSKTNTLCVSRDDLVVHTDTTQDELKEVWVRAGGSGLTAKPDLQLLRAIQLLIWTGDVLLFYLQPERPLHHQLAGDQTACPGKWPDRFTSLFSTWPLSTHTTLSVSLILPNRAHEEDGPSAHISSLMSLMPTVEIEEVSWQPGCQGYEVS